MKNTVTFSLVFLATMIAIALSCPGCATDLDEEDLEEAEDLLVKSLARIAAGADGPSYKLAKINSATSAVVAGTLYKLNADLEDDNGNIKTCDIEMVSLVFALDDPKVTFKCPGEEELVRDLSE